MSNQNSFRIKYTVDGKRRKATIKAKTKAVAKAVFGSQEKFRGKQLKIHSCEQVAEAKPVEPVDPVVERLQKAETITDEPPPEIGSSGKKTSEKKPADSQKKLTRREWAILEKCALLDENDADNGKRLMAWFGDKILHVQETGWHLWTGKHWDYENGEIGIERFSHDLIPLIKREAALLTMTDREKGIVETADDLRAEYPKIADRSLDARSMIKSADDIKKAHNGRKSGRWKFAIKSGDRPRTVAMIKQVVAHKTVTPRDLDLDDLQLNCLNGTLVFERQEDSESEPDDPRYFGQVKLKRHDPKDLITKLADCKYDREAKADNFLKDLEHFMPDEANREFLKVFMGYVILGGIGEQVYCFFYGDGANWKSAFLQAIARTVGTYYKPMSYTSVSGNNMPTGDKPSPDWARLPGVRFLTIEEIPRKEPIKEELVKMVTSGADMPVRHLNRGLFDMRPSFTCVMTSNAEPNISGHDKGIWRRTLILPWEVTIEEAKRLPFDQVMEIYDRERSGILNWLIDGACKYLTHGLFPFVTPKMKEFTASVRADRDATGSFILDCVINMDGEFITAKDLYFAFKSYCEANGIEPILNQTAFGRQVKRCDVDGRSMFDRKGKVQGVRRYKDIALADLPGAEQPLNEPDNDDLSSGFPL